jgi:hypothetical protein
MFKIVKVIKFISKIVFSHLFYDFIFSDLLKRYHSNIVDLSTCNNSRGHH